MTKNGHTLLYICAKYFSNLLSIHIKGLLNQSNIDICTNIDIYINTHVYVYIFTSTSFYKKLTYPNRHIFINICIYRY